MGLIIILNLKQLFSNIAVLMIPAKKNKLINFVFSIYLNRLLRKHFYRIHLTGEENLKKINASFPVILYANHSNWWDGFIAYLLTAKRWTTDDYLMMDIEQMKKYSFFKYIGVFSVDRNDAKEAVESIDYAVSLLQNSKRFLWIFPQGLLQPQDLRPLKFYSGITKIAGKLGAVNLLPVTMRYEYIIEQRPEVFIKIGEPDITGNNPPQQTAGSKDYTNYLQEKLINDLDKLKELVINQKFDEFKIIFKGKNSRNKSVDKFYKQ